MLGGRAHMATRVEEDAYSNKDGKSAIIYRGSEVQMRKWRS